MLEGRSCVVPRLFPSSCQADNKWSFMTYLPDTKNGKRPYDSDGEEESQPRKNNRRADSCHQGETTPYLYEQKYDADDSVLPQMDEDQRKDCEAFPTQINEQEQHQGGNSLVLWSEVQVNKEEEEGSGDSSDSSEEQMEEQAPDEQEEHRGGDSSDSGSLLPRMNRDSSIACLSRCSRSDYGSLASLNRSFRNTIRSGELYRWRRLKGIVEHWIYFSCALLEWEAYDPIRERWTDWFGTDGADYHSRNVDRSVLSKFLQAHPADYSTKKLQEVVRLMREKRYPAAFKCYHNFHKVDAMSSDNIFYKMVIHVHSDSGFRRYQKDMRLKPGLWPLYRGFFVDINLFSANKETAAEISSNSVNETGSYSSGEDDFADEDANLMVKLKFLTYKLRTFLIRNGLSILFKEGPAAYKAYYLRQMKIWGTSPAKQRELSKMLDEWAVYIRRKCGNKQLSSSTYLSEAEPFLEQFAKRSPQNQVLIGSAGNLVRTEDFLAIVEGGQDEEGDLVAEREIALPGPNISVKDTVPKHGGLIVFFPGIPGCAKSSLCKELLNAEGGLEDGRPVHSLMGDLIKGKYWQKVAAECKKKPNSIMLADKNAPNEEVWKLIEDMCHKTRASAVPVVAESEGTDSNPFSLDSLAIFMFRVLQRVNHPGNLDKASPNAGYVLLMFYYLYQGRSRKEFEGDLIERFGSLVKMPLLKSDRNPLPEPVQSILEEGIDLYKLHTIRHGRLESTKGSYAKEWIKWEKELRVILCGNAEYFNSIQVPFEFAVKQVFEQLRNIANGHYTPPDTEIRKFGTIVFAALTMPVTEIKSALNKLAESNPKIDAFLKDKHLENLNRAHLTLAHKRSHGIKAVADYGIHLNQKVPVELTALLFSDKMAAFEACPGSVEGEKIVSKNPWPHITLWTAEGVGAKEANMLPQLLAEGKANRIDFNPPIILSATVDFY